MTKSQTKMRAGRAVAVYVEDGQGRRLILANDNGPHAWSDHPIVLATTQTEAKQAIAVLHQLLEELPP